MPRKKKLPECIRRHGAGYRAVCTNKLGERKRSLTMSIDEAVTWRDNFRKAEAQPATLPPLTLAVGLQLIKDECAQTAARGATTTFYVNHARPLFAGLGGDAVLVHRLTAEDLRGYVDARLAAGVNASTIVGKELFVLRRLRKLALARGYILPVDPFAGLRLPKFRTGRFDFMTKERVAECVAKMRAHGKGKAAWHADLVELLFATGIRRAELSRLRVRDIQFDNGRIEIDGKTGLRYQSFGVTLEPVLRRLAAKAKRDGRIISSFRVVEKACERWQKKLGEPRLMPHVLRHSYGSFMASRVTPFDLMGLMGHTTLAQTSRYYHARGDAIRGALDALQLGQPTPPPTATPP